jgi:hypothetical protein
MDHFRARTRIDAATSSLACSCRRLLAVALAVVAALGAGRTAHAQDNCLGNLLQNASFEQHTGATNSIGDPIPATWVLESGENGATVAFSPPDGSWIGYVWGIAPGNPGVMTQQVPAVAGITYNLTFYSGSHDPAVNPTIEIRFYDAANSEIGSPAIHVITTNIDVTGAVGGPFQLSATAPAGVSYLKVIFRDPSATHAGAKGDAMCLTTFSTPTPTSTATPTRTPTPTATPTVTATPTFPPVQHYQCYETHGASINLAGVSVEDVFGPSTVTVKRNKRICAPADKNGEAPDAVADPRHLNLYTIKQTDPGPTKVKDVTVTNQFGDLVINVGKPDRLLVPTAKSLITTPGQLPVPLDHFKCYKSQGAKFRASGIAVETQFGPLTVDIKKPLHLCAPANKNGEDPTAPGHPDYLMCYQVKGQRPATQPTIYTNDQFGPDHYSFFGTRELCVPSQVTLPNADD